MLHFFYLLSGLVAAQRGSNYYTAEVHPTLQIQKCTKSGGCQTQTSKIVIDANWRWLHGSQTTTKCYNDDQTWNSALCPDPTTCATNCFLEGISSSQYQSTYGVYASGSNLTLLLFPSGGTGSRVYLMNDDSHYQEINLVNQEVSFTVDVSGLPCGANGALYFVNMAADGGKSLYSNNQAGAMYGTGYCDAQCRQDLKFINGQANLVNWNPRNTTGRYGSCCHEVDIWEANAVSTAMTMHPCSTIGQYRCDATTTQCDACDKNGCDFNPYRVGNTTFYGSSGTVSTAPGTIRVTTAFKTNNGLASGNITQVTRSYIRGGKTFANAASNVQGVSGNVLSDTYCTQELQAFGEPNTFAMRGGMYSMTNGANLGMVLTMSTFIDYAYNMQWLDSVFPAGASTSTPGNVRGKCPPSSTPPDRNTYPNAQVQFSNIRIGDIGTTA